MSRKLYFFVSLTIGLFLGLLFMSNSGGAGFSQDRDRTGSPLSNNTCAGCHGGGNFGAGLSLQILDDTTPVTSFEPGKTYMMKVSISRTGFPAAFGFQATALTGVNHEDAGTFGTSATGTRIVTVNDRHYFEHSRPNSALIYTVEWTPDESLQDTVWLYAAGLAANGNGSTSGDQALVSTPIALVPSTTTAVNTEKTSEPEILTLTPFNRSIQVRSSQVGKIYVEVIDLNGRRIFQNGWYSYGPGDDRFIQMTPRIPGIYFFRWQQNQHRGTKKMALL